MKNASLFLFIAAVCAVSFLLGYNIRPAKLYSGGDFFEKLRRDTIRICDTVERPVPVRVAVVRYDTLPPMRDTVYLPVEAKEYLHRIDSDSLKGEIRTLVSGYDVSLDSLVYDLRISRETLYVEKRRRWGFTAGPQIGLGYDGRFSPYIGIGITYGFNF